MTEQWTRVDDDRGGCTERLAVEGGYLYRAAWQYKANLAAPMVGGCAMVFVPVEGVAPAADVEPEPAPEPAAEVPQAATEPEPV